MSSEPSLALILLGMGIDELSMPPLTILQIKKLIRSIKFKDAQKLADEVLKLSTGQEVEELSRKRLKDLAPDIINTD